MLPSKLLAVPKRDVPPCAPCVINFPCSVVKLAHSHEPRNAVPLNPFAICPFRKCCRNLKFSSMCHPTLS